MSFKIIFFIFFFSFICLLSSAQKPSAARPNIILIYIDDLGYGDVGCYGAKNVKTPNVDFLAANGLRFTDAHCGAATCTPSRFSLLTGKYAFRNKAAVLPGDAPLLIDPKTITLPRMLQQAGYKTAVVGKWHLGLGNGTINWNGDVGPGPLELGFDYSFIIPATTDRVPTVYVENHRVPNLDPADPIEVSYVQKIGNEPTGLEQPSLLKMKGDTQHSNTITNGISRIGFMKGGKSARWVDEEIADVLTKKATDFIAANQSNPFFLYFSVPDIHVPRAPNARFAGSSSMGKRGDVIAEMDWMTGMIRKQIQALNLGQNTLIIFTSDNGPVLDDGYDDKAEQLVGNHKPAGPFRGGKYSAFEGGTRVPTIVYWPGRVPKGESAALLTQVNFFASIASLLNLSVPKGTAADSKDQVRTLLGQEKNNTVLILEESYTMSLRQGKWKYIAPASGNTPTWFKNKNIESGLAKIEQLYDLSSDPGEQKNVAAANEQLLIKFRQQLFETKQVN